MLTRDQILVDADHNPRSEFDDTELMHLAASIKTRGLLQSITVRPADDSDERFYLVAGERRLRALDLIAADTPDHPALYHIPVVVIETQHQPGDSLVNAVVENVQRVDMSIVDEANAYARLKQGGLTIKGIAQELGVPQKRITERLDLLSLPESVIELLGSEQLPPSARKSLKALAEVSPLLCEHAAGRCARTGPDAIKTLVAEPGKVVLALAEDEREPFWRVGSTWNAERIRNLGDPVATELANKLAKLDTDEPLRFVGIPQEEADLMVKAKVGIEVDKNADGKSVVVCVDLTALLEVLTAQVARREQDLVKLRATQPKPDEATEGIEGTRPAHGEAEGEVSSPLDTENVTPDAEPESVRKHREALEAARQREVELAETSKIRGRNLELGRALVTEGAKMKLTRPVAEVLCFSLLSHMDTGAAFQSGLRLCLEAFQAENDKTRKVVYKGSTKKDASLLAWDWVTGDSTVEGLVGRTISLLIASRYADKTAQPESQRVWPKLALEALPALDTIAAELVPETIRNLITADDEPFMGKFDSTFAWHGAYGKGTLAQARAAKVAEAEAS